MSDRLRLVVMGDSFVGKSAVIKRFLFGTFVDKYTATVEDLYSRDFELSGNALNVDILDTAGDAQFPAMRRYRHGLLSAAPSHDAVMAQLLYVPSSASNPERSKSDPDFGCENDIFICIALDDGNKTWLRKTDIRATPT